MFLITTIYSFKQPGRKKNNQTVSLQSHPIRVCHKVQTKQAMCDIRVRPFRDRTAKRQAKSPRGSSLHVKWWFWALGAGGTGLTRPAGV